MKIGRVEGSLPVAAPRGKNGQPAVGSVVAPRQPSLNCVVKVSAEPLNGWILNASEGQSMNESGVARGILLAGAAIDWLRSN